MSDNIREHVSLFERNDFERVELSVTTYKGKPRVDLRKYYRQEGTQDWFPTKSGVSIRLDEISELIEALKSIDRKRARQEAAVS